MEKMSRRLCECHGEPMLWRTRNDRASGGQWNCPVKLKTAQDRYNQGPKGLSRSRQYKTTDKGRKTERLQQGRRTLRARTERILELERSNHWLATQSKQK